MLLIQVKLETEVEVEEVVDPGKVEVEEVDLGSEAGQHRLTESLAAILDLLKKVEFSKSLIYLKAGHPTLTESPLGVP